MKLRLSTVCFLGAAVGCSSAQSAESALDAVTESDSEDAIVGGRAASERAVVALVVGGEGVCTGTLVAPRVVLTARHCVSRTLPSIQCPAHVPQVLSDHDAKSIVVMTGTNLPGTVVARGQTLILPNSNVLCAHDAAAILLDRQVKGVTPLDVSASAPAVGDKVRFVGFGRRGDAAGYGQKRSRRVTIDDVLSAEFLVGEVICNGDSGGPALSSAHRVVGIVSRGGPTCNGPDVINIATRADVFESLVERAKSLAAQT